MHSQDASSICCMARLACGFWATPEVMYNDSLTLPLKLSSAAGLDRHVCHWTISSGVTNALLGPVVDVLHGTPGVRLLGNPEVMCVMTHPLCR